MGVPRGSYAMPDDILFLVRALRAVYIANFVPILLLVSGSDIVIKLIISGFQAATRRAACPCQNNK